MKITEICPACFEKIKSYGQPAIELFCEVLSAWRNGDIYAVQLNNSDETTAKEAKKDLVVAKFLEKHGYIVTTDEGEFILMKPLGLYHKDENFSVYCRDADFEFVNKKPSDFSEG